MQIKKFLTESSRFRTIGGYCTDGIGKTTLFRKIYDTHEEVSDAFDVVNWVTVA